MAGRPHYYKLNPWGEPVPCDMLEAAKQLTSLSGRCVACDKLPSGLTVSTAFLVFDHAPFGHEPVLWNTCVYSPDGRYRIAGRYSSLDEAITGHREILALVRLFD